VRRREGADMVINAAALKQVRLRVFPDPSGSDELYRCVNIVRAIEENGYPV